MILYVLTGTKKSSTGLQAEQTHVKSGDDRMYAHIPYGVPCLLFAMIISYLTVVACSHHFL